MQTTDDRPQQSSIVHRPDLITIFDYHESISFQKGTF